MYKIVHSLYHRAGLLKKNKNGGYDLRVHSIRKFFQDAAHVTGSQRSLRRLLDGPQGGRLPRYS